MAGKFYLLIEDNKLINRDNAQEIVDYLNGRIGGMTFYAANIQHLSDPTIQAGDVALAVDHKGKQYATLVTRSTFTAGEPQKTISAIESESQNTTKKSMAIRKAVAENNAIQNNIRNTTDWSQIWRDENGNEYVITVDITDSGVDYVATPLPTGISIDPTSPFRTEYTERQAFSTEGVIVYANYSDGTRVDVTDSCKFVPSNGTRLYNRGTAKASISTTIDGKKYSTYYNYIVKADPTVHPYVSSDAFKYSSANRSMTAYQLIKRLYERHQNSVFDRVVKSFGLVDEEHISSWQHARSSDTVPYTCKKLSIENNEYFISSVQVTSESETVTAKSKIFFASVRMLDSGKAYIYLYDKPLFAYRVLYPYGVPVPTQLVDGFDIGCSYTGGKVTQEGTAFVPMSYLSIDGSSDSFHGGTYHEISNMKTTTPHIAPNFVEFVNVSGFDS